MNHFVCQHIIGLPIKTCLLCHCSSPQPLVDLCINYINNHLEIICDYKTISEEMELKPGIILPTNLCEHLINTRLNHDSKMHSNFFKIFKNTEYTNLTKVNIYKTNNINETVFQGLLKHKLKELSISHNNSISSKSIKYINENSENLISLHIGDLSRIFSHFELVDSLLVKNVTKEGFIFKIPLLKCLSVNGLFFAQSFYSMLIRSMTTLTQLDLTNCENLGNFKYSKSLINLSSLILHNVRGIEKMIKSICNLKTLKHLDISTSLSKNGQYINSKQMLTTLIINLSELISLDISGTNLTDDNEGEIPGFNLRKNNPFRYLGLYRDFYNACQRTDIPAKLVSGNANEEQLLIAAKTFFKRPDMLVNILKDILLLPLPNNIYSYVGQILNVVLDAMNMYLLDKNIQNLTGKILLRIVKKNGKAENLINVKQKIISSIFICMDASLKEECIIQNGCFILCEFNIPSDMLFDYDIFVKCLPICLQTNHKDMTLKKAIYLLNCVASEVTGVYKLKLGELGVVQAVIQLIKSRIYKGYCDEVLETAWLALWNMSDETPLNCKIFLQQNGLQTFFKCFEEHPSEIEMLGYMMGLLSNIAEVSECRHHLMNEKCLRIFSNLLNYNNDCISYHSVSIILHLISDGPDIWTIADPSRNTLLNKVSLSIDTWNISSMQDVNYTSLKPFFYLFNDIIECQKWAAWSLASLTHVNVEKYSPMIEAENGFEILDEAMTNRDTPVFIRDFISTIFTNCNVYKRRRLN